jgi:septal ring factor EnvC (AmiA/AmiB activator)
MKRTAFLLLLAIAAAFAVGCEEVTIKAGPDPEDVAVEDPYAGEPIGYLPSTSIKGGKQTANADSAVASAMELQEKYAKAMERMMEMQRQVVAMEKANHELQKKIASMETARAQDARELKDANERLFEMKKDLEKWKKNVFGFQGEMRQALVAIMKSQERVLKLLGAEQVSVNRGN